jgi:hypothetical protein
MRAGSCPWVPVVARMAASPSPRPLSSNAPAASTHPSLARPGISPHRHIASSASSRTASFFHLTESLGRVEVTATACLDQQSADCCRNTVLTRGRVLALRVHVPRRLTGQRMDGIIEPERRFVSALHQLNRRSGCHLDANPDDSLVALKRVTTRLYPAPTVACGSTTVGAIPFSEGATRLQIDIISAFCYNRNTSYPARRRHAP